MGPRGNKPRSREAGFAKVGSILNDLPKRKPDQSLLDAINEEAGHDVTQKGLHRDLDFFHGTHEAVLPSILKQGLNRDQNFLSDEPTATSFSGILKNPTVVRARVPKGTKIQPGPVMGDAADNFIHEGPIPASDVIKHQPYEIGLDVSGDLTPVERDTGIDFPEDYARNYYFGTSSRGTPSPALHNVGHVDLTYTGHDYDPQPMVSLSQVNPAFRGQGLGRRLYEEVIQDLAKNRPDLDELRSSPSESLMSAYSQGTWRSLSRDWPVEYRRGEFIDHEPAGRDPLEDGYSDSDLEPTEHEPYFSLNLNKARRMLASPTRSLEDPIRPIVPGFSDNLDTMTRDKLDAFAKEHFPESDFSSYVNQDLRRVLKKMRDGEPLRTHEAPETITRGRINPEVDLSEINTLHRQLGLEPVTRDWFNREFPNSEDVEIYLTKLRNQTEGLRPNRVSRDALIHEINMYHRKLGMSPLEQHANVPNWSTQELEDHLSKLLDRLDPPED